MIEFKEDRKPSCGLNGAYIITHVGSGRKYVGSTSDLRIRRNRHLSDLVRNQHPNTDLQTAYAEDPRLDFHFIVTETRDEAYDYEQGILDKELSSGILFNLAPNARTGVVTLSEVSRQKISKAHKGRAKSEETREKIRQSKLGVPRSEAMREFLRQRQLGKKASEETRRKQSEMRKGKPLSKPRSPEHMAKIAAAKTGFRHSAESILRIRENSTTAKPIVAAGVKYPSASEAARALGIDHKTIRTRIADSRPQFKDWYYG